MGRALCTSASNDFLLSVGSWSLLHSHIWWLGHASRCRGYCSSVALPLLVMFGDQAACASTLSPRRFTKEMLLSIWSDGCSTAKLHSRFVHAQAHQDGPWL